ncbi:MAG: DUF1934 domain-containing protein [Ruminococcus sp.]|nr:DUF1934 domain-containing protein [Ruminococcus sp.]HAE52466.1 DUF1934 domain-containing protein [Ruminococcus sp.]
MKTNALISLAIVQWQDGEKNETELLTRANVIKQDKTDIISYEDTEATGFEGSVTTIQVEGSRCATITRKGTANSSLYLEMGKKNFCQYETPYGSMQIGVLARELRNTISKDGKLYMKYTLDLNSSYLSDNEIIMTVKND